MLERTEAWTEQDSRGSWALASIKPDGGELGWQGDHGKVFLEGQCGLSGLTPDRINDICLRRYPLRIWEMGKGCHCSICTEQTLCWEAGDLRHVRVPTLTGLLTCSGLFPHL